MKNTDFIDYIDNKVVFSIYIIVIPLMISMNIRKAGKNEYNHKFLIS